MSKCPITIPQALFESKLRLMSNAEYKCHNDIDYDGYIGFYGPYEICVDRGPHGIYMKITSHNTGERWKCEIHNDSLK